MDAFIALEMEHEIFIIATGAGRWKEELENSGWSSIAFEAFFQRNCSASS